MPIRAVIFDLDGVLVTTDEFHYQAWKRLAEEEGIPFSREINHRQRGIGRMESLEVLLETAEKAYSDEEKHALAERKNTYYREALHTLTPDDTLPGARELLRGLRARGVRTAIGSASRNTPLILERTDLRREVDAVADGNDASRSKPDPEVFLIAAAKLDIPPEACLVVEDAAAGLEAGRRAGMGVYAIGAAERHPDEPRRSDNLVGLTAETLLPADAAG